MFICMSVLKIFCMRRGRGIVSKALLMSIVATSVLCAGLGELRASRIVCEREVSSEVVECWDRNLCCVGDSGI